MNIVLMGCVKSSEVALATLLSIPEVTVAGVVTVRRSAINSDYVDLTPIAEKAGVPIFYDHGRSHTAELVQFIHEHNADYVFCIGWSQLLTKEVLAAPKRGVIGYHPTLLPKNRGRHPIIWAIALGLTETGSSLFLMDEGADSGPIISQKKLALAPRETAGSLYNKLLVLLDEQLRECVPQLAAGTLVPQPQDHTQASYWHKRGKADGEIDWNKPAIDIDRLVRALGAPYPGAHFVRGGRDIIVAESRLAESADSGRKPGEIVARDGNYLLVKCGQGMLWILPQEPIECEIGEYLHG